MGSDEVELRERDIQTLTELERQSQQSKIAILRQKNDHEAYRKYLRRERMVIAVAVLVILGAWYKVRLRSLRKTYATQYAAFTSAGLGAVAQRTRASSDYYALSIETVLVAAEFPSLHTIRNALGIDRYHVPIASAQFLLIMLQEYKDQIKDSHWAGSAGDLNAHKVKEFARSYAAWSSDENVFRFLLPSRTLWENSVMICEQRRLQGMQNSDMYKLFNGGLCRYALERGMISGETAVAMAYRLVGQRLILRKKCRHEATQHTVDTVSQIVGVGMTVLSVASMMGVTLTAGLLGPIMLGITIAATAAASAAMGVYTYRHTPCTLARDEFAVVSDHGDTNMYELGGRCGIPADDE